MCSRKTLNLPGYHKREISVTVVGGHASCGVLLLFCFSFVFVSGFFCLVFCLFLVLWGLCVFVFLFFLKKIDYRCNKKSLSLPYLPTFSPHTHTPWHNFISLGFGVHHLLFTGDLMTIYKIPDQVQSREVLAFSSPSSQIWPGFHEGTQHIYINPYPVCNLATQIREYEEKLESLMPEFPCSSFRALLAQALSRWLYPGRERGSFAGWHQVVSTH